MNLRLFIFLPAAIVALGSCRDLKSDNSLNIRPILEIRQENSLPAGQVNITNSSSYALKVDLGGSETFLPPGGTRSYSGLTSEVHFYFSIADRSTDKDMKVAWCNAHPYLVGTDITVNDPP